MFCIVLFLNSLLCLNRELQSKKYIILLQEEKKIRAQSQSIKSKTKFQPSNIWVSLLIFWTPAKSLGHFTNSAHFNKHSLYSRLGLASLHCCCCLYLVITWYWHLQNAGVLCCDCVALSSIASHRFSSCYQSSTSFSSGFSTAAEATTSPVLFPGP